MTYTTVLAIAAFLSCAVIAAFVILAASIHNEERHMSLTAVPRTRIGATTRHLTGVGVRTPEAGLRNEQAPGSSPESDLT